MNLTENFWDKVYRENAAKMNGICRRYVQHKEIAEDLMQDAFLAAINKFDKYSGIGSFEGWLRKVTINTTLMYLRNERTKKITKELSSVEEDYQSIDQPDSSNIRSIIEQAGFSDLELLEAINCLPEHHRLVFNLYVIDNYTHAQIGKELNISAGTSKSHLARARKKIQQILYTKALEKTQDQNNKKRRSAFIWAFIGYRTNDMDRLFKSKLRNFEFEPTGNYQSFSHSVNWKQINTSKLKSIFIASKTKYWLLGITTGLVGLSVFLTCFKTPSLPTPQQIAPSIDCTIDTSILKSTPIEVEAETKEQKIVNTPEKNDEQEEPIVVKKKIIEKKTITIRDTIQIKDTIHAE